MRIWIVTNVDLGRAQGLRASGIQNCQTAMALADRGHSVCLWIAGDREEPRRFLAESLGRPLPPGLHLLPFERSGERGDKKTPFATPAQRIWNAARAWRRVGFPDVVISRSPRVLSQLRASRVLPSRTRLLLEYQHPEWALLWRGWRASHPGRKLRSCVKRLGALRDRENDWLRSADGVLYAARAHEALLERAGFDGPTQPLASSCPPPGRGPAADESVYDLGYMGSLEPGYGLETLLEAMTKLDGATLRIAGAGPPAFVEALERQIRERGLGDRVHRGPRVDPAQVRGLMQTCRLGVVPLSARHGPEKRKWASPLNLFEWMAAGVPVLASRVASVAQHVEDGRDALLFAPDSAADLARAAAQLLADESLCAALSARGRELGEAHSYPERARRIEEFCQGLVRG